MPSESSIRRQRLRRIRRLHGGDAILAAGLHELLHQRLHGAARHEHAELGLEQPDLDVFPEHLRIALLERGAIELDGRQLEPPMHFERLIDVRPRASGRRTARRSGAGSAARTRSDSHFHCGSESNAMRV